MENPAFVDHVPTGEPSLCQFNLGPQGNQTQVMICLAPSVSSVGYVGHGDLPPVDAPPTAAPQHGCNPVKTLVD